MDFKVCYHGLQGMLLLDSFFSEVFQLGKHLTPQNDRKFHADSKYAHIDTIFGDLGSNFLRQVPRACFSVKILIFALF